MLSYIDRGNIGNAYTAGMGSAWGITSNQYSWIITAYYLAYIAFQWFILLWKVVSLPVSQILFLSPKIEPTPTLDRHGSPSWLLAGV
jgi:hypothetical protein